MFDPQDSFKIRLERYNRKTRVQRSVYIRIFNFIFSRMQDATDASRSEQKFQTV